jgi:hypothetical protein
MAKLAIVCDACTDIEEVNGTLHRVTYKVFMIDNDTQFRGHILCQCLIEASDNSNKVREAYVTGVIDTAALQGITLAAGDVVSHQFFRAP